MVETFAEILAVGGKSNSLGRSKEVIEAVLDNREQLAELYSCVFNEDSWTRMRAVDALEKVCRQHPDWLLPYVDKIQTELASSTQPSIQWHLAQMYRYVNLSTEQKLNAVRWIKELLSSTDVDWIVAVNAMQTLVQFTKDNLVPSCDAVYLLNVQQQHKSRSVVKKASKLLLELSN